MTTWFGTAYAAGRAHRYEGTVHWMYHSDYMQKQIQRAYHNDTDKPCALYRAKADNDGEWIVGESLVAVKNTIRVFKTQGRDFFHEVKQ